MLAVRVVEFSIRNAYQRAVGGNSRCTTPRSISLPKDAAIATAPVSFQTILHPAGRLSRAGDLVESDMQVVRTSVGVGNAVRGADLLAAPMPGDNGRRPQFSVMLLQTAPSCGGWNYEVSRLSTAAR